MPRRPPRSRLKKATSPRAHGARRARTAPGRGRKAARKRTSGGRTAAPKRAAHVRGKASPAAKRARRAPAATAKRKAAGAAARKPAARGRRPARRFAPPAPERVSALLAILDRLYPDAGTALDFMSPLQLLIATILSAQCTDKRVNMVTPGLFERWPDAAALAAVPQEELEAAIRSTGFFRNKARSIRECCADIMSRFGGRVPDTLEDLTSLRGVGRKTANVVLGNAFGIPGMVVDTHVTRLSNRLGLVNVQDAVKIEFALMDVIPRERWTVFSHWLILHGRAVCVARKPRCSVCPLAPHCPRSGVTTSQ